MSKFLGMFIAGLISLPMAQAQETISVFKEAEGVGGDDIIRDHFVLETENLGTVIIKTDGTFQSLNYALPNIDQDCGLSSVQYQETQEMDVTKLQLSYEINCYETGYAAYAEAAFSEQGVREDVAINIGGFNIGPTVQHGSLVFLTTIGSISIFDQAESSLIYSRSDLYKRYNANSFGVLTFDPKTNVYRFPFSQSLDTQHMCLSWPSGALGICH